jgi:sugar (pentulose or hexulose) kinase
MVLAFMDGAAFELRWALETLEKSGFRLRCLWMVGGAVRNRIWPRIVADVTGLETRLIDYSHGPALGAALLAATGTGLYESAEAAAGAFAVGYRELHPRDDFHEAYDRKFSEYQHFVRMSADLPGKQH